MAADASAHPPAILPGHPAIPPGHPAIPLRRRLLGLGSVYGKSLRDLWAQAVAMGVVAGLLMMIGGALVAGQFPTAESRLELAALSTSLPPVVSGLLGDPVNVDRLGGFLSWRIGSTIPVLFSIWAILAMSGTLAGEASRGVLEVVLAAPLRRRRLAFEKAAAFITALVAAMAIASILTWLTGQAFGTLPRDDVPLAAAGGQFTLYGIEILAAGALAFALGPLVGRASAAGLSGAVLFASYMVDGFSGVVPLFDTLDSLSWFTLTAGHRPLAGTWDWGPVVALALVSMGLVGAGIVAFDRRDLASAVRLPVPGLPRWSLGTSRPVARSFGDRLPAALAWGLGTALIGIVFSLASTSFAEAMSTVPAFRQLLDLLYPGIDATSPGGFLQIGVFSSGVVLFGLAAATAVSGWASDESTGRLDVVLSAPIRRARWAIESGLGAMATAPVVAILMGVAIWMGARQVSDDPLTPAVGTVVLGLYMLALIGIGLAVGGLVRPGLAGPVVVILTVAFYLIEIFGVALDLPDWFLGLSLNHHLGQPMIGQFNPPGIVASLALAGGGLLLGTWGLARRDLRG